MAKRRTKEQKQKASLDQVKFEVDFEGIGGNKKKLKREETSGNEASLLRSDLTKVIMVFMLAVGSELVVWWFFFR